MSEVMPDLPSVCWPVNWNATTEAATLDPIVKQHAAVLAGMALRHLTGYQVGGCPIIVTPRRVWTTGRTWIATTDGHIAHFFPDLRGGLWVNGGPCSGSCPETNAITLPAPVWGVERVTIDGVDLDPDAYHVEDGRDLVRTDGQAWPLCSDAWEVVYLNAAPVDAIGAWVAGILATEYAKALQGGKGCRLPKGTTSVIRSGISFEVATRFDKGLTGIQEVDAWVATINPYHLDSPTVISSPDLPTARQVTWRTSA